MLSPAYLKGLYGLNPLPRQWSQNNTLEITDLFAKVDGLGPMVSSGPITTLSYRIQFLRSRVPHGYPATLAKLRLTAEKLSNLFTANLT